MQEEKKKIGETPEEERYCHQTKIRKSGRLPSGRQRKKCTGGCGKEIGVQKIKNEGKCFHRTKKREKA